MISKGGTSLLRGSTELLKKEILTRALIVTPNIPEAEILSSKSISSISDMKIAAEKIHLLGVKTVLIKGGHLEKNLPAVDIFFDGRRFEELSSERIETKNTHGTGCTFSAAVCAFLAMGMSLAGSLENSKAFVTGAIRNSLEIGKGHGPLNHFWKT